MSDSKDSVSSLSVEELKVLLKEKTKAAAKAARTFTNLKKRRARLAGKLAKIESAITQLEASTSGKPLAKRRGRKPKKTA
ncbi:MAG: hypothetical protein LBU79_01540 [Planctomycetota bacterium]|jgi:division protein CdvB (Snf7/Vps24/ESCRT-III family)|nr:hypothetical protein [Planctomycetota bacterium]